MICYHISVVLLSLYFFHRLTGSLAFDFRYSKLVLFFFLFYFFVSGRYSPWYLTTKALFFRYLKSLIKYNAQVFLVNPFYSTEHF